MAVETLFPEYIKTFSGLIRTLIQKLNGEEGDPSYLFRSMFKKQFEPTMKWENLMTSGSISTADVVSTDSKLPLKVRDALSSASGTIPKMGMKMQLREGEMVNIDIMEAQNTAGQFTQAIKKALFGDTKKVTFGILEKLEYMSLQGLSTGVIEVDDTNNVGTNFRVEFAIPSANQFGAGTVWSNVASTPLTDIESVMATAEDNGHAPKIMLMDRATFNNLRKTTQVKERYAAYIDISATDVIKPGLSKVNAMLEEDFGIQIAIITRSVYVEINGVKTSVKCWASGKVAFVDSMSVGTLHYGLSAESRRPVSGVNYATADDYILVSKFAENEPLAEYTASQAYVIPVLDGVDAIYQLDSANTSWT